MRWIELLWTIGSGKSNCDLGVPSYVIGCTDEYCAAYIVVLSELSSPFSGAHDGSAIA